jgi:hypothetical protein
MSRQSWLCSRLARQAKDYLQKRHYDCQCCETPDVWIIVGVNRSTTTVNKTALADRHRSLKGGCRPRRRRLSGQPRLLLHSRESQSNARRTLAAVSILSTSSAGRARAGGFHYRKAPGTVPCWAAYSSLIGLRSASLRKSAKVNSCGRASWRQLCHSRPAAAGNEVSMLPGAICAMNT